MSIQAIAPRVGVAVVFLAMVALVLGVTGRQAELREPEPFAAPSVVIVTNETLRPAFASFGDWIAETGGASALVTIEQLRSDLPWMSSPAEEVRYLNTVCRRQGFDLVLLGGDETQLGEDTFALEPSIVRASVANLDQAWQFVEACRANGWLPGASTWFLDSEIGEPGLSASYPRLSAGTTLASVWLAGSP